MLVPDYPVRGVYCHNSGMHGGMYPLVVEDELLLPSLPACPDFPMVSRRNHGGEYNTPGYSENLDL